ncbi:GGDEF domain-containing protein [Pantoea cypripedii]|uniref:diguanylate cyclase n=1 Tax=Pantoea cypripedii TaxID=55209 RepID=A0A6B9GI30_PANCY|nr:GGDEF domain-containing protein [Pantoea cypripedii]QGY33196.1 GGDEF domain-containing protein [Pantoea cypripedii]
MPLKLHSKLIHEAESPRGLLYRMIILYTFITASIIILTSIFERGPSNINIYFSLNLITVIMLAGFIRKSFHIKSQAKNFAAFRIGLFLLLNSSLASMAGGLKIFDRDVTALLSAFLYIPAISLIMYSFNNFVFFVNDKYKSAVYLSLTDELTQLPNRRHMNIKLREIEQVDGLICILDIDDFKKINDTYDHDIGDKVLRKIGDALSHFINENTFIARSGGEEFSAIITGNENLTNIIENIKISLSTISIHDVPVTTSIGVAKKRAEHTSSFAITAADSALYESKRNGKNRITYSPE